jgi:hypothetical protein
MFSQKVQEELGYYVYCLVDPRDKKIFYVGKGVENRVFAHVNDALELAAGHHQWNEGIMTVDEIKQMAAFNIRRCYTIYRINN